MTSCTQNVFLSSRRSRRDLSREASRALMLRQLTRLREHLKRFFRTIFALKSFVDDRSESSHAACHRPSFSSSLNDALNEALIKSLAFHQRPPQLNHHNSPIKRTVLRLFFLFMLSRVGRVKEWCSGKSSVVEASGKETTITVALVAKLISTRSSSSKLLLTPFARNK